MKLRIIGIIFLLLSKSLVTTSDEDEGEEDCEDSETSGDDRDECTERIQSCRRGRTHGCSVKIISHCTVPCCSHSLSIHKKTKTKGRGVIETTYYYCRTVIHSTKVPLKRSKTELSRGMLIGTLSKPVIGGSSTSIRESLTMGTSTLIVTPSSINRKFLASDLSTLSLKTMATTRLTVTPSSINTKFVSPDAPTWHEPKISTIFSGIKSEVLFSSSLTLSISDLSTLSLKTMATTRLTVTPSSINTKFVSPDAPTWHEPKISTIFSGIKSEVLFSSSLTLSISDLSTLSLKTMATTRLTVTPSSINTKFVFPDAPTWHEPKISTIFSGIKSEVLFSSSLTLSISDLSTLSLKTMATTRLTVTPSSINTKFVSPDASTWHEPKISTIFSEIESEVLFSSSLTLSISESHRYPMTSERKSHLKTKSSVLDWPHSSSVYPSRSMTSSITNTCVTERETSSRTSTLTEISSVVTTIVATTNLSSTWPVTSVIISPTKSKEVLSSSVETPKVVFCNKSRTGEKSFKGVLKWNRTRLNTTSQLPCPYGPPGENAVRKCEIKMIYFGAAKWSDVNDRMCATRPSCLAGNSGSSFENGILYWPKTAVGMRANVLCPYNDKPYANIAYRLCQMNATDSKPFWDTIHKANCSIIQKDNMTMDDLLDMKINEGNERRIAALVNYLTSHLNTSADVVTKGADVMKNLVEKATDLYQISTDLLNLVSNVMNINSSTLAAANQQNKSTEKILTYIGRMMENIDLTGEKSCCQTTSNVISTALDLSNSTKKLVFPPNSSDVEVSITLPSSLLKSYDPGERVYFFNFKNDKLFPRLKNSKAIFINSEIISATIKGKTVNNLSDPVVIEFKLSDTKYSGNSSCVFWDFEADGGYGAWSKIGCEFEMIGRGRARCSCNHLTYFGILVDLFPGTTNGHRIYLEKITFIGCYLSIVGLVFTMITLLSFKKYRADVSGKILFNLCLALFIALLVFVVGIERAEEESSCVAIAALLHYFILVVFLWMGIEAFYMFLNIVLDRLPGEHGNIFILKCAAIAWVLPMFVVLITVLMKTDDYRGQSFCRVHGNSFYIAFLVPIVTILIFNFIIFILVIKSLLSDTIRAERRSRGLIHFRRVLGIMTVLGITWIFGILAVGDLRIVFQYLFCISTSLQGFSIFVIYCMTDRNVRERLVRLLCLLPDPNWVIDPTSTQQPTDIVINLEQFEPVDRNPERYRRNEERRLSWVHPEPDKPVVRFADATVVRPRVNVPLYDDEPMDATIVRPRVNVPLSDEPVDATIVRPRVNVPLSDEPVSGVDELVKATLAQSGLTLQQSIGETSIGADGSVIFFDNGRIVDVPRYPEIDIGESPRQVSKKRRRASKSKEGMISETSKDLRRWSEMGWSPRLKNYSQNLPDDVKPDDGLKEISLSQFQKSKPKPFGTTKGVPAELPVRVMAGDDVERGYFDKYREDLGNVDGSLNNSGVSAAASGPIASISNVEIDKRLNVENIRNSDSTESDSSSNSSLKWSEINSSHWIPGPRSLSRSTIFPNDDDNEIGQENMSHFQEL